MDSIRLYKCEIVLIVLACVWARIDGATASVRGTETTTPHTGTATDLYPPTPKPENEPLEYEVYDWPVVWTSWSEWSTCSTTIMTGFRVRNRVCPRDGECAGDDVQLVKCNIHTSDWRNIKRLNSYKYIDYCKKNDSLSCKLYLEKPTLAYNIFRQNSCFFTVNNDEEGESATENGTDTQTGNSTEEGRDARDIENSDVIISLNSEKDTSIRSRNFVGLKEENDKRKNESDEDDKPNSNISAYSLNVEHAVSEEKKCRASCDSTLNKAVRLWAVTTRSARSVSGSVSMISRNTRLTAGIGVMFFEYNSCVGNCNSIRTTYYLLTSKNASNGSSNKMEDSELKEILETLERNSRIQKRDATEKLRKKRAAHETEEVRSLCGGDPPKCPMRINGELPNSGGLVRLKRQGPQEYNPCFSKEYQLPWWEINNKVEGVVELFFYESFVQRFICRKCRGPQLKDTGLFLPRERVVQFKNKKEAFCRQGFLKRHALFIVEDPKGEHLFNDGTRFSIEARTFEVESHCEIVIQR